MSGCGRETLPDVWEWSVRPPECLHGVGRPSRMSGSGREGLQDVQEWSRGPPGCPGVVLILSRMFGRTSRMYGKTSRMSGSGPDTLPDVRKDLPNVWK